MFINKDTEVFDFWICSLSQIVILLLTFLDVELAIVVKFWLF